MKNIRPVLLKLVKEYPILQKSIAMIDQGTMERNLFASLDICTIFCIFHVKKNMTKNYSCLHDKSDLMKQKIQIMFNYLFRAMDLDEAELRRVFFKLFIFYFF